MEETAPAAAVCVSSLLVFGSISAAVATRRGFGLDLTALKLLGRAARIVPDGLDADSLLLGGKLLGAVVVAAVLLALVAKRQLLPAVFLVTAVTGAVALDPVLKAAFKRPAVDPADHGYSFPSGSAMVSVAALAALILLARGLRRRLVVGAVGAAIVVAYGFAIVYARWHYPSDVVAGWSVGAAWATGTWLVARAITIRNPAFDESTAFIVRQRSHTKDRKRRPRTPE